jgi:opacity protein-like surface antigen
MKNIFCLLLFTSMLSFSQESEISDKEKFSIGLHYVGNVRNENSISDNFNGIIGLDAKYVFAENGIASFQGGITLDYLQARDRMFPGYSLKNTIIWNPNIGVELDVFKTGLKPFLNLGYSFFNTKYKIQFAHMIGEPEINQNSSNQKFKYDAFSINPGLRYHFKKLLFIETSYKYLPEDEKISIHFFNIGLGVKF